MSVAWSEELSVGVETIDRQHQRFIVEFNNLLAAFRANEGTRRAYELVDFLEGYAAEHFAEEERTMRSNSYPALEEHLAQHRVMTADIARLQTALREDGASMTNLVELSDFLLNWLVRHIRNHDQRLGAFLRDNGQP